MQQFGLKGARFTALQWGYAKGPWSGRACGITVMVGPRHRNHIVSVHEPPRSLAGRAAAIRIKTKTRDILVLAATSR